MGSSVSQAFRSSALLTHRDGKVSEATAEKLQIVFEILQTNPKVSIHTLDYLLTQITKHENILAVHDDAGYNILQRAIGLNQVDLVKWLLNRHNLDVNRSPCSLPLHIACVRGNETLTELLLKHGARVDTEARMCFPNAHSPNCEERGKYGKLMSQGEPTTTKLQNALAFAIDGDHFGVLSILTQKIDEPWPWVMSIHLIYLYNLCIMFSSP